MINDETLPSPVDAPTRPEVRRWLDQELGSNAELEAFILDYFEQTYRELTHGMNRTTKVNELFHRNSVEEIKICLDNYITERNSKSSIFNRIKKAGRRRLKKLYIFLSILFGVIVEYFLGPVGKLIKVLGLTTVASATAITGGYIIITHTNIVPSQTVATLNKQLGTKLLTPAMRDTLAESEVVSATTASMNDKQIFLEAKDMGSISDTKKAQETEVTSNSNENEFKRQITTSQMKLEHMKQALNFALSRIEIIERESKERDRRDRERDRKAGDMERTLTAAVSHIMSLEQEIKRLK